MPITAKVLADSVAPCGKRLTTLECIYPRFIHSEVLTHRMLSRNSASSRAIPTPKLIQRVIDDPVIPAHIGRNQKGMQAAEALSEVDRASAVSEWLQLRDSAVETARRLHDLGVHKQIVNRAIEPWIWITVIISATEWENFFALRCHKDAEPHFQELAHKMRDARDASTPNELPAGGWHLPLIGPEDYESAINLLREKVPDGNHSISLAIPGVLLRVSVGRCARVSYLTHDGKRDLQADIDLHDRLLVQRPLHASPAEHVAQALPEPKRIGNLVGWRQYRKSLPDECIGGPL